MTTHSSSIFSSKPASRLASSFDILALEKSFRDAETFEDFVQRCASIRVVVSDVDGTLTDGGMYYTHEGEAMKRFSAKDGMGITLLQHSGIEVVMMTSDNTLIPTARAEKLRVHRVFEGVLDKSAAVKSLANSLQIDLSAIAFIGDDVNDESAIKLCGLSACPSDGSERIKRLVHYVCKEQGGKGAFREFAEVILAVQGKSNTISLTDTHNTVF